MGLGVTILAGIFFGIIVGIGIIVTYSFIKTWRENKKVLKINPNIVKEIELNKGKSKTILNGREKRIKEIRERNRLQNGFTTAKPTTKRTDEHPSDKEHTPERSRGVQIPKTKDDARQTEFTLRD